MAFPTNPPLDAEYSFEGKTWRWNGTAWVLLYPGTASDPGDGGGGDNGGGGNSGDIEVLDDLLDVNLGEGPKISGSHGYYVNQDVNLPNGYGRWEIVPSAGGGVEPILKLNALDIDGISSVADLVDSIENSTGAGRHFIEAVDGSFTAESGVISIVVQPRLTDPSIPLSITIQYSDTAIADTLNAIPK